MKASHVEFPQRFVEFPRRSQIGQKLSGFDEKQSSTKKPEEIPNSTLRVHSPRRGSTVHTKIIKSISHFIFYISSQSSQKFTKRILSHFKLDLTIVSFKYI